MRKRTMLLLAVVLASLAGCGPPGTVTPAAGTPPETSLHVFAAASLSQAFETIGSGFERMHPGVQVVYNFGGSNQLARQIVNGAPAAVFASANMQEMEVVIASGQVGAESVRIFARNRLVVVYPEDNPAGLRRLQDLARPGLKLVLAAREVPAGQYALDFLEKATRDAAFGRAFREQVLANVVSYEENVRAVLNKVVLGEADAGIVYVSDAASAAGKAGRLDIPDALNSIATYPVAPIKAAPDAAQARAFVEYLLRPEAQQVLVEHGFLPGSQ